MKWMVKQVSLYATHSDNIGRPASYRQILLSDFGKDFPAIYALRKLDPMDPDYKKKKIELKSKLQCFTPSALLENKAAGQLKEIHRTGIMQLDFDYDAIKDYDVEELKQCVFSLPFIGFCGLSCSGKGFYALALIAEPERLNEYAEHCFDVLLQYGIKADTSKGKKIENLRYLSYDGNMLIREDAEILKIKRFKPKQLPGEYKSPTNNSKRTNNGESSLLNKGIEALGRVQPGSRWETVQKVAYTLGGLNDNSFLDSIKQAIESNSSFAGEEKKYLQCADVCFNAGSQKPLLKTTNIYRK